MGENEEKTRKKYSTSPYVSYMCHNHIRNQDKRKWERSLVWVWILLRKENHIYIFRIVDHISTVSTNDFCRFQYLALLTNWLHLERVEMSITNVSLMELHLNWTRISMEVWMPSSINIASMWVSICKETFSPKLSS